MKFSLDIKKTLNILYKTFLSGLFLFVFFQNTESSLAKNNKDDLFPKSISIETKTSKFITPKIISSSDAEIYKQIFFLQQDGNFVEADKLIKKISNNILLGHVQSQRYLHPNYRSSFSELQAWLKNYSSHPEALRIYNLAKRKGGSKNLKQPEKGGAFLRGHGGSHSSDRWTKTSNYNHLPSNKRKEALYICKMIKRAILRGKTKNAKDLLFSSNTKKLLTNSDYDNFAGYLGFVYFLDNMDNLAVEVAVPAAKRTKSPIALWSSGLAFWRLGKYDKSLSSFSQLAGGSKGSDWIKSAGAFWAYRSAIRLEKYHEALFWLDMASEYHITFYGILAKRTLGKEIDLNWEETVVDANDFKKIANNNSGKRAFALLQAEQKDMAEMEFRHLYSSSENRVRKTIYKIAGETGMAALAARIAGLIDKENEDNIDKYHYPIPDWNPEKGWIKDKALVFALIKQESGFNASAGSGAGAKGLMQLKPSTAALISKNREFRKRTSLLYNPSINISLGQDYLSHLMEDSKIGKNLFFIMTSYNAGPGNFARWIKKIDYRNDPLLYIEAIPSKETRDFIERVMSNMWVYRHRMGQKSPSLDMLASGGWPIYVSQDNN